MIISVKFQANFETYIKATKHSPLMYTDYKNFPYNVYNDFKDEITANRRFQINVVA